MILIHLKNTCLADKAIQQFRSYVDRITQQLTLFKLTNLFALYFAKYVSKVTRKDAA